MTVRLTLFLPKTQNERTRPTELPPFEWLTERGQVHNRGQFRLKKCCFKNESLAEVKTNLYFNQKHFDPNPFACCNSGIRGNKTSDHTDVANVRRAKPDHLVGHLWHLHPTTDCNFSQSWKTGLIQEQSWRNMQRKQLNSYLLRD